MATRDEITLCGMEQDVRVLEEAARIARRRKMSAVGSTSAAFRRALLDEAAAIQEEATHIGRSDA